MRRKRILKLALFVIPAVLSIGVVYVHADHKGGYIDDPSLYYSVGVNGVGFSGRNAHSDHRYAIENYSKYDLEVTWEFAHKVMLPDKSLFRDISEHDTVTVKANKDKYDADTRSTTVPRGSYYIDAYTSVDIKYKKRRAGHSKRIKYDKASEVTSVHDIE